MPRSYSILVIDDELGVREDTYKAAFKNDAHFVLHFVYDPSGLDEAMKIRPDGYLLDIVLDQGSWGRERWTAEKVIEEYLSKNRSSPVFLVSSKWSKPDDTLGAVNAMMTRYRDIVRDFFDWSWFSNGVSESPDQDTRSAVRGKLRVEMDRWHRRSAYEPAGTGPLRILHISDLQFGDPGATEKAFQSGRVIANTLVNTSPKSLPDFIVVTGDITYSGAPSEFEQAAQWIDRVLLKVLWPQGGSVDRERLFVIPGNHDVNLRLCLADQLDYDFDIAKKRKGNELPVKSRKGGARGDLKHYGLEPFLRFAEQVSVEGRWREKPHHSWVSNRFAHLGIQFVLLNTVDGIDAENPDRVDLSEELLNWLSDVLEEPEGAKEAFRILILHHPFFVEATAEWTVGAKERLNSFLGANHIDLVLAGHSHGFLANTLPNKAGVGRPGIPCVVTATLRLGQELRGNEDRRGFVLLELDRDDTGRIVRTGGKFYELLPGKIGSTMEIDSYPRRGS